MGYKLFPICFLSQVGRRQMFIQLRTSIIMHIFGISDDMIDCLLVYVKEFFTLIVIIDWFNQLLKENK